MTCRSAFCACILFVAALSNCSAQTADVAKADFAIKSRDYAKALATLKKAIASDPYDVALKEKLAYVYMAIDDYVSAEALYAKLITDPKGDKADKFYYAQALRNNGKYDLAEKAYAEFANAMPNDMRAKEFKNFGNALPEMLFDRGAYDITDIPENSDASDVGPVFCLYDMCISSNRSTAGTVKHRDALSGEALYDLYLLPGGSPVKAGLMEKLKGSINSRLNEGPATFSADGAEMIFTRSNYNAKAADGTIKLGLYHASYDAGQHKWGNIQPLNIINYNNNMAHPSLSKDGKQLFFVSDMPGGFGETDIYVCTKLGNDWSTPVNLGKDVNTPGRELFPFISDRGLLFFSSDSRIGLGGLDIYSAYYNNGQWGDVQNLGAPFNTGYDDFGYICDERQLTGYFVSNRPGGKGSDDIYKFVKKTQNICGAVVDENTKKDVVDAKLEFVSVLGEITKLTSGKNGEFCVALDPGVGYFMNVTKPGYCKYEAVMKVSKAANPRMLIVFEPRGGIALTARITDQIGRPMIKSFARLTNINSGETEERQTDSSGSVSFDVNPKRYYSLQALPPGVNKDSFVDAKCAIAFNTMRKKFSDTLSVSIVCNRGAEKTTEALLPNLYFEPNSFAIRPEAALLLDDVVKWMKAHPNAEISLTAYCDFNGSEKNDPVLAVRRAQACVEYLGAHGVDKTHLLALAYADREPPKSSVQSNSAALNRKVVIKVMKE